MTVHQFNASQMINPDTEIHYRFHVFIVESDFPQVHDFFELSLSTAGQMLLTADDEQYSLAPGALVLIRPGVIHDKQNIHECQFINLAFPTTTMHAIFEYLGELDALQALLAMPKTPMIQLSAEETARLKEQLQSLSTLPRDQHRRIHAAIRRLLVDCMDSWFIPLTHIAPHAESPVWIQTIIRGLNDPANLVLGKKYMLETSGVSREHLCRTFQRYLGISPNLFLNQKRLNYAANLLLHSDHTLIDIAYEVGFQSESAFYHNFTSHYGISPGKYRKQHSFKSR